MCPKDDFFSHSSCFSRFLKNEYYIRATALNFDSIVTKICIYLANGPETGEFEYGQYRTHDL